MKTIDAADDLMGDVSGSPSIVPSGIRRALRLEGAAILLVDPDPGYVDAITLLFRMDGAQVRAVASAKEAVRTIARWRPNVLLCDPDAVDDRVHLALRAGGTSPLKLAATPDPRSLTPRQVRGGYDAIVRKPFDVEALVTRIELALWSEFGSIDLPA